MKQTLNWTDFTESSFSLTTYWWLRSQWSLKVEKKRSKPDNSVVNNKLQSVSIGCFFYRTDHDSLDEQQTEHTIEMKTVSQCWSDVLTYWVLKCVRTLMPLSWGKKNELESVSQSNLWFTRLYLDARDVETSFAAHFSNITLDLQFLTWGMNGF